MEENTNNEEVIVDETNGQEGVNETAEPADSSVAENTSVISDEPTEEQLAFQAKVEALGLEKGDVVVFRNGEIGRIDATSFELKEMIYRIYVKFGVSIATLDENLVSMNGDKRYDVQKILSSDFTTVKKEIEFTEVVLTKEEAEAKLSEAEGQTVIIE